MPALLLGLAFAAASAACYSVGISLQAREARKVGPEHSVRLTLLRRLVRRPAWVLGISLDGCGWALQAVALALAPLTVVQPALAVGLVFLLVLGARTLGEQVGRVEAAAVLAIAAGVAGLARVAPEHSAGHAARGPLLVVFAALAAIACLPYVAVRLGRSVGILLAVGAGLAFACDGLATKLMTDEFGDRSWPGLAAWLAVMVGFAALGTLGELSALQTMPVTRVAPVVFVLTTLIPVGLAPVLAGETWTSVPVVVVSAVTVLLGGAALARSRPVGALMAGPRPTGSTERRSVPSAQTRALHRPARP